MTERIVSLESTLAIGGTAIALHLFSQNRAAQRAVRWLPATHGAVLHTFPPDSWSAPQDWEAKRAAWVHENTFDVCPEDYKARRAAWVHENTIALRGTKDGGHSSPVGSLGSQRLTS